jgi:hypothetical protein
VHPYRVLVFGSETELVISCKQIPESTTTTQSRTVPGFPYGQPLPCRTIAQAYTWPAFTACALTWGGALLLAVLGGLLFKRARVFALRSETITSGELSKSATAAVLASENGIVLTDSVQLHTTKLNGDNGGVPTLNLIAGRPNVSAFLADTASEASKAISGAVAVDCYVCGSAGLLADASDAFYGVVAPACSGSAFHGLHYAIG